MEVAAEALLVCESRDAHDHRVLALAVAEELQRRGLAADLVDRVVQVGEVLDLGERQAARLRHALRHAEDRRLVEHRVEHAARAERLEQSRSDVVDAALLRHVFAKQHRVVVRGEEIGQRLRQAIREMARPRVVFWQFAAKRFHAAFVRCDVGAQL